MQYVLYLIVFLLPLQTRWMFKLGELNGGYYEYATMSIYFTDILLLLILLIFITRRFFQQELRIKNYELRITNFWWLIAGLELFIFISIFFASDKWLALYGYGRFLLGIGLFFLITQIKYDKVKLYWVVIFSGIIQSILAMHQFVAQQVYSSKWLGMATQYSSDLGVSVVDNGFRRWLRAYGSLPHPNILGGFLVVCLLINIILYFNLHQKLIDEINEKKFLKHKIKLLVSLLFFIINFVGLLLTFSRSAWFGLIIGMVILASLVIKKYGKIGFLNISKFIFIIIALSGLAGYILNEPMQTRLGIDGRLEDKSIQERIDYTIDAKEIIKNNWLFGIGIKNYGLAVHQQIDSERSVYKYEPAHNVFLLVWAETGILGLLAFMSLLVYLLMNVLQDKHYGKTALIFTITTMMIFDHWWWTLGFGIIFFWFILGIIYKDNFLNS